MDQQDTDTAAAAAATASSDQQRRPRPPHLSIDIPAAPSPSLAEPDRLLLPTPTPTSQARRPPPLLRSSPSFMLRQTVKSLLLPVGSFKSSSAASFPNKLFGNAKAAVARTSSLPLADDGASAPPHPSVASAVDDAPAVVGKLTSNPNKPARLLHICRSQSLPMNTTGSNSKQKLGGNAKSFKRMGSLGGVYRVVPSTPRTPATAAAAAPPPPPDTVPSDSSAGGSGGEDDDIVPEEEAVCRICMVELSEGSDSTLKLACACKGELALAHEDCAVRWFSIKGSSVCEVCKQEVRNLPVTLLRVVQQTVQPNRTGNGGGGGGGGSRYDRYRVWHGTPILVIISILAYFCFLEQLLVAKEGVAALAISLPFSCILGLFSSLTTTSMVARRYVWVYAAVQFLFVVFFTHLFYRYLHLQAVISIILATFAGFGVGMTGNSIVVEILRWKARRVAPPAAQARRRRRRPRPAQQQQQAQEPSSAHADEGVQQPEAVAAGDVENPPAVVVVPQP